ncbi:MAG: 16S rRNA (uracil(1498)-N(3))-methyltransferase [Burkholderiaceae bacterium]
MLPRILHPKLSPGPNQLSEEASHHLVRVLRATEGDAVVLFNGQGQEARAVLSQAHPKESICQAEAPESVNRESSARITVIQALCLGDKMDWVVQKACELGASRLVPVRTSRSQLKLDADRASKRQAHWQRIADAAAAQCGRNQLMTVLPVNSFEAALSVVGSTAWLLDPFADQSLSTAPLTQDITLAIGPEAGWSDEEEALAKQAGFLGVRCGPRILRTETAAAAVLTAIAVRLGEF